MNHPPRPAFAQRELHPMDYYAAARATPKRPGALVALGVVSLLVGVLSLLASGFTTFFWSTSFRDSLPPAPSASPNPLPAVSLPHYTGETLAPRGLPRARRAALIANVTFTPPFTADRREMLDRLLAEYGQDLLSPDGQFTLTPIAPRIRDTRPVPWAANTFQAPIGTLTVDNVSARIERPRAAGGDLRVVRDVTIDADNHQRLQAGAIDRLIPRLRAAHPSLTQSQVDFIADTFAKTIRESRGGSFSDFVRIDSLEASGIARVTINRSTWWLLPDGRSVSYQSAPRGIDVISGQPNPLPVANFRPALPGNPSWMLANAIHSAADLLLALFLLVAALRTLTDTPAGARALLRFATLKAVMVVIEIFVCVGLFTSVAAVHSQPRYIPALGGSGDFDTARGIMGLIVSVIFQSVFVAAIFITLYSFSVRRYLSANGGLYLLSLEYRVAFAHLRRRPFVHTALRAASVLTLLLAIIHLASSFIWNGHAGSHVPLALLSLFVSLLCFKWSSTPRPAFATALLALIALFALPAAPAAAQDSRPTSRPTTHSLTPAEIDALVNQARKTIGPARSKALSSLASAGAPAVSEVLALLQQPHFVDDSHLPIVGAAWQKSRLLSSDAHAYDQTLKALPDLLKNANGHYAIPFLDAFPPKPEVAPYYARFAGDYDKDVRQAVARRSVEIDDAQTLFKQAEVLLDRYRSQRANVFDTLHRVGRPGLPHLARMARAAVDDDAIAPLAAMTPAGANDPRRANRLSDMRARDFLGHPVEAPTATLTRLDDPALPDECVAACAQAVVAASKRLPTSAYASYGAGEQLCRQAAYTLARGGRTGHDALFGIVAGRKVSGSPVPLSARIVIMRELAGDFPALEGVVSDARGLLPESRWPAIAAVVRAVIDDPDRAPATLATMLASQDRDEIRAACDVLANIGLSDRALIDPALHAFRSGDADTRQLLASAFCRSTLKDDRLEALERRIILGTSNTRADTLFMDRLASSGASGRRMLIQAISDPAATPAVISRILTSLSFTNVAAAGFKRDETKFSDPAFRRAATDLLLTYVDHPSDALTTHIALLDDPREPTRQAAAQALTSFINRSELGPVTQAKYEATLGTLSTRSKPQVAATPAPVITPNPVSSSPATPTFLWHVTWLLLGAVALFLLTLSFLSRPLPPLEAEILD
jgi:hypothetical protein